MLTVQREAGEERCDALGLVGDDGHGELDPHLQGMANARACRSHIQEIVTWRGYQRMCREGREPFVSMLGGRRHWAIRAGGKEPLLSHFELLLSIEFQQQSFPFSSSSITSPSEMRQGCSIVSCSSSPVSRGQGDNS